MKRTFINQSGDANKFWHIEQSGNRYTVCWGKIGTAGRSKQKEASTQEDAAGDVNKLIREKLNKGYIEISETDEIPQKAAPVYKPMDEDVFWEIIDSFHWKAAGRKGILKPAIKKLVAMQPEDIKEFAEILAEKLYQLDGPEYAVNSYYEGYLSPDGFLYDRCAVVAEGREFYFLVLNDPTQMPEDLEFEDLLYLPGDAYYEKMKIRDEIIITKLCSETGSNEKKWQNYNNQ
ncbi:MAG: DUF4240 domain-containing protein [Defluviitaleaceae bacterium]|nr:DUF4240 domain-containing protein [Defluviitaleaceae bacterium]